MVNNGAYHFPIGNVKNDLFKVPKELILLDWRHIKYQGREKEGRGEEDLEMIWVVVMISTLDWMGYN